MLYERYEKRAKLFYKIKKLIYKNRISIIIAASVMVLLLSLFMSTKGIVYNVDMPSEIIYGEKINESGSAVFSSVLYEYRAEGEALWTSNKPVRAGNYQVRVSSKGIFGTKTKQYDVVVKPKVLNISFNEQEIMFGGEPSISADLINGDRITYVSFIFEDISSTETNVMIDNIIIEDNNGVNVIDSYEIPKQSFSIIFSPIELIIAPTDVTKVYDATELISNQVTFLEGTKLLDGHTIEIMTSSSITNVGETENMIVSYHIFDGDIEVTNNYRVTINPGLLTITPRPITIETLSNEKVYDGVALNQLNHIVLDNQLIKNHITRVNLETTMIDVGETENKLDISIYDDEEDVTYNYQINYINGLLKVAPKPILIKTFSLKKVYNALPVKYESYEIIGDQLIDGHNTRVFESPSIINVGEIENRLIIEVYDGDINESNNYEITYDFGRLEIVPRPITIETGSLSKVYDGFAISSDMYQIDGDELIVGHTTKVVDNTSIINVGEVENSLVVEIYDGLVEVTDNYDITYNYGILKVTPKPIHIKPIDKVKVYDGYVLASNEVELVGSTELVENHHVTITTTQTLINVDKVDNLIISHQIFDNQVNVTDNYEVTYQQGVLEITPRKITLKPVDKIKFYDDTELTSIVAQLVDSTTLASNDSIHITTDGSIINVGEIENTILSHLIVAGEVDVTDNYIVEYQSGSLEITPRPITIKTIDKTKEYDGIALTSNEIEFLDDTSTVIGHEIVVTTSGSITDVAMVDNNILTHRIYKDGVEVTDNYAVTYQVGTLEVKSRLITIKPKDAIKVYDNMALTSNMVEFLDSTELVNNHQISITTAGYIIDVSKIENKIVSHQIYSEEDDVSGNYKVVYQVGTLEITPLPINIKPKDKIKEYDDSALTSNEIEFLNMTQLIEGHTISITTNGSIVNVGVEGNQIIKTVIMEASRDVTANYLIRSEAGSLTVTPRLITIKTGSSTKVYDGIELIDRSNQDIDNKLLVGHTIAVFSDTRFIDVDKKDNILTIQIFKDTIEVTYNYDISYVYGSLEVTSRPLVIKPTDKTKEYDGTPLVSNEVYYLSPIEVVSGHEITITTDGTITNVGFVENNITSTIIIDGDINVTPNYLISFEKGLLTITPRLIMIETESKEKIYDGLALINHNHHVLDNRLVTGHMTVVIDNADITDVGSTSNILEIHVYDGLVNVTSNYEISYIYGMLKVVPRSITIQTSSNTKVYDKIELYDVNHNIIKGTLVDSHYTKVSSYASIIDVGSDNNRLVIEVYNGLVNVSLNYLITYEYGLLEVTPRPITVETNSSTKVYDGLELFNLNYDIIDNTLVEGQVSAVSFFTTITNVGVVDNVLTLVILDNLRDVTFNYEINYINGLLEITPRAITVLTGSSEKIYDGIELVDYSYIVTSGSILEGHLSYTEVGSTITEVGEIVNVLKVIISDGVEDVSTNYEISYVNGTLKVNKRPIIIKPVDKQKVYDGLDLTSSEAELIESTTIVSGHVISITTTGSISSVGRIDNQITSHQIFNGATEVTTNYQVTYQLGTLEITPRIITIKPNYEFKEYDGTPLTSNEIMFLNSTELVSGHQIFITTNGVITNVGIVENEITNVVIMDDTIDVSINYLITFEIGLLEIIPRPITIETGSSVKVYDGLELFNHDYQLVEGNLIENHSLNISNDTKIVDVGSSPNELVLVVLGEESDVSYNYEITYVNGLLEITTRTISVITGSNDKVYDGLELTELSYELVENTLLSNHSIMIENYTSIIDVCIKDNQLSMIILDGLRDITFNYEIIYDYGILEITPRMITIQTASNEQVYNGLEFFDHTHQVILGSLVSGHQTTVNEDTRIINVSEKDNMLSVIVTDGMNDITSNYLITYSYGTLIVTPLPITIKPIDVTKEYDGTPLISNQAEVIGANPLIQGHGIFISTNGSLTEVGEIYNFILTFFIKEEETNVSYNYSVTTTPGLLEVTKRHITIKASDAIKVYDGIALINQNYEIFEGSLVRGHQLLALTIGSQLEIGNSNNIITNVLIQNEFNEDQTLNYSVDFENGVLEVTPRLIDIGSPSKTKLYDGLPLEDHNWLLLNGSLVENHILTINVTGTITNPGETFNTFEYTITDAFLNDVSHNYTVKQSLGILTVLESRIELIIQSGSDSKGYDGVPLTNEDWKILEGSLIDGHDIVVVTTGFILEPGKTKNTFTYYIVDENSNDVTESAYKVTMVLGDLIVFDTDINGNEIDGENPISSIGNFGDSNLGGPLFKVYSEVSQNVYLREKSDGDYKFDRWGAATPYYGDIMSPLSLPGKLLTDQTSYNLTVQSLSTNLSYYMPYYSTDGFYDNKSDVRINHGYGLDYTVSFVPYTYEVGQTYTSSNSEYDLFEQAYRTYVYDNYLQIPDTTKAGMLRLANENGLDKNSSTIINDVKDYIQNAAIYNLKFSPFPEGVDYALYFLEHLQEGICQHFALAGVMMYRALGIPARNTIGFVAPAVKNQWVEVSATQYHAWVEIYIDGFGWVPIEVTAGGVGGGIGGSGGGSGQSGADFAGGEVEGGSNIGTFNIDNGLPFIEITSLNKSKIYDGTPLENHQYYYTGKLLPGHQLIIDFEASITRVGEIDNKFFAKVINEFGEDVSNEYNLIKHYGQLVVVPVNNKPIIEFQLFDIRMTYQGIKYAHEASDYWIPSRNLPNGYTVKFDIVGEITDVGRINTYISKGSLRIYDENKLDVTTEFNVVTYDGSIEVWKRQVTITSASAEKNYDGSPLTADVFYISKGSIVTGHNIAVTITGSIIEVGIQENTISEIVILDEKGLDVTKNYKISEIYGDLLVHDEL